MKAGGIIKIINALLNAAMAIISYLTGEKKKGGNNGNDTKRSEEQ